MKAIYLVGFMGSGKTTIGAELANRLELPVVDTDHEIEQQTGRTIADEENRPVNLFTFISSH